jgi:DHA2 family multidrug resistance protein
MVVKVSTSEQWKPKVNPWLIAATVALAAFMEVLDTSIANVALPHIAGDLGASTDQGTWVLTSYLVSNAIILPASPSSLQQVFFAVSPQRFRSC